MRYFLMALSFGGIVAADQLTKYLVVKNIALHSLVEAVPGLFSLTYTQNTGAAFSSFLGMQWLFLLVFAVFTVFLAYILIKNAFGLSRFEQWLLVFVYAGGFGNMLDRVRLGYVVDMIHLDFMDFPVFNVADCFITCSCIVLMIHLFFFNKAFWKDKK